jgi:hypothetical protein
MTAPMNNQSTLPCRECGCAVGPSTRTVKLFCSKICVDRWNNRRRQRGEKLYDLMMILRYDRVAATEDKVFNLMCRMARVWREEDKASGRQSHYEMRELRDKMLPYSQISGRI